MGGHVLSSDASRIVSKRERIAEVFRRLAAAPAAASPEQAQAQLEQLLVEVEDQFSGLPNLPDKSNAPRRMYPLGDPIPWAPRPGWSYLESQQEHIYLGPDGAIEVKRKDTAEIVFRKAGGRS